MTLGEKIKYLMLQKGISQKDLASKIDVSQTHVGYIIKGEREPTVGIVKKISDQLNVSVDWLLDSATAGLVKESKPKYNINCANENIIKKISQLSDTDLKMIEEFVDRLIKRGEEK